MVKSKGIRPCSVFLELFDYWGYNTHGKESERNYSHSNLAAIYGQKGLFMVEHMLYNEKKWEMEFAMRKKICDWLHEQDFIREFLFVSAFAIALMYGLNLI